MVFVRGPDLRQRHPGRRDQPHPAQDPGRAAGGHAGAAGDRRRRQPRAGAPVLRAGHPEPDRDGGHLSAARGAARPLHAQRLHRLPARGRRAGGGAADHRRRAAACWRRCSPGRTCCASSGWCAAVPIAEEVARYAVRLAGGLAARAAPGTPEFVNEWVRWGAGLRAAQFLVLGAKARALLAGASTSRPTTSRRWRCRCCATACCWATGPRPKGSPWSAGAAPAGGGARALRTTRWPAAIPIQPAFSVGHAPRPELDLDGPDAHPLAGAAGARRWSRGCGAACTAAPTTASRWSSPSTGRTARATTCASSTGACTPAPTGTTSRSTRTRPTCAASWWSTRAGRCRSDRAGWSPRREYAATLAATLASFLFEQGDAVGVTTFAGGIGEHLPARNRPGHLRRLMRALERPGRGAAERGRADAGAGGRAAAPAGDGGADLRPAGAAGRVRAAAGGAARGRARGAGAAGAGSGRAHAAAGRPHPAARPGDRRRASTWIPRSAARPTCRRCRPTWIACRPSAGGWASSGTCCRPTAPSPRRWWRILAGRGRRRCREADCEFLASAVPGGAGGGGGAGGAAPGAAAHPARAAVQRPAVPGAGRRRGWNGGGGWSTGCCWCCGAWRWRCWRAPSPGRSSPGRCPACRRPAGDGRCCCWTSAPRCGARGCGAALQARARSYLNETAPADRAGHHGVRRIGRAGWSASSSGRRCRRPGGWRTPTARLAALAPGWGETDLGAALVAAAEAVADDRGAAGARAVRDGRAAGRSGRGRAAGGAGAGGVAGRRAAAGRAAGAGDGGRRTWGWQLVPSAADGAPAAAAERVRVRSCQDQRRSEQSDRQSVGRPAGAAVLDGWRGQPGRGGRARGRGAGAGRAGAGRRGRRRWCWRGTRSTSTTAWRWRPRRAAASRDPLCGQRRRRRTPRPRCISSAGPFPSTRTRAPRWRRCGRSDPALPAAIARADLVVMTEAVAGPAAGARQGLAAERARAAVRPPHRRGGQRRAGGAGARGGAVTWREAPAGREAILTQVDLRASVAGAVRRRAGLGLHPGALLEAAAGGPACCRPARGCWPASTTAARPGWSGRPAGACCSS